MRKKIYTKRHLQYLRTRFPKMTSFDLMSAFNKRFRMNQTLVAIRSVLSDHNITAGRPAGIIKGTNLSLDKKQIRFLKRDYRKYSLHQLHEHFNKKFNCNKSLSSIKSFLQNHKITGGRKKNIPLEERVSLFNAKQVRFIQKNYGKLGQKELAAALNKKFGLHTTASQVKFFTGNHHINSGRTGFYPRGHVPANKGIKGHHASPATEFKKGHIPANKKTLGSERLDNRTDKDKTNYVWIKVAEKNPYTGAPTRYRQKHVVVWEEHHGPVPAGMIVILKDSDSTNCDIDNLALVNRAELLQLNQLNYKKMPPEIKPALLTMAKLKTKLFAAERTL